LGGIVEEPKRPLTVVMGGAKVSDKLPIIQNLLPLANNLIITGGMIFTFLKAMNKDLKIGHSLFESGKEEYIFKVLEEAKAHNVNIYFPKDFKSAPFSDFQKYLQKEGTLTETPPIISTINEGVHPDYIGLDIGPETVALFNKVLSESSCVALNGPSGLIEHPLYRQGTVDLFNHISDLTSAREDFISVIGGGDSVNAIRFCKEDAQFSHVSTGGGASLELLEGKRLPGIYSLSDKD
jgi:phosphoglycerate kinase